MQNLNVIIAGAGMGGLSAAIALRQAGHNVHLYERAAELAPIGAAISIWPNGMKVLHALGVGEAVEAVAGDMRAMSYSTHTGELLTRFSLDPLYRQVRQRACPIARAELQRLLLEAAGPEHVTLGVGCEGYTESQEGVSVHLSTGESVQADLLIAANGTHSALRNTVAGERIDRRYCGYVNWNGRIRMDAALSDRHEWAQFVGEHKRVSLMPMGTDEFYFFFDVPLPAGTPNVREQYREELLAHFAGWAQPVQQLIDRLDPAGIARVEIHDTQRVPHLASQRVALLGDAAHAMTPNIGQGGCQAMEDAWVLARSLEGASSVQAGLQRYEAQRADRVANLVLKARERAAIIHGEDETATQAWYAELPGSEEAIIAGLVKTTVGGPLA
ncbi:FAD-dependent urate hydroxylase HpxO [Pseudomonas japonica]|uniref:FAD-dependent urate hydroxylase HpxO n=1 Tax=Pseudomonas japonica TaxID=256466 RepID=UPI0015E33967|nr:FAD-dependent urate hydroxylase HpxO [Pseudomonas japonica]MBA1245389.1 FAD-dependent urate hydroxylase HpxO [Pseudomonas japonica]